MADEFGDTLRDLAQEKLRWPPAQRGLGAHLQRLIELEGPQVDATLVNRWLRNETAPPLDSLYLPALRDALKLTPDEYERLYRALAHSRGAALPLPTIRPLTNAGDSSPYDDSASSLPPAAEPPPRSHERRDRWLLLVTAVVAAALAVVISRVFDREPAALVPTRTIVAPGGRWIAPGHGFVVTGDILHFAARAYPTSPTDPPVVAVYFTATWQAPDGGWRIACRSTTITPGTPDTYECDWPLTANVPTGQITVSFDVYDTSSSFRKSPHGVREGEVRR